jgi:hypothetical protein
MFPMKAVAGDAIREMVDECFRNQYSYPLLKSGQVSFGLAIPLCPALGLICGALC